MKDFIRKHTLIAGTLLLTATGFLTRVLGFFYRIFLSRTIGAEGLGLYNMVHPLYGICFALCAGSIQTAVSQFVAANVHKGKTVFRTGLCISLSLAAVLAWLMCRYSDFLATHILMESRCAPLLPFMALSVPFSAVHACINGYYYGTQKARVPAMAQVVEQVIRMGAVFLIADILVESGREINVQLAVAGHLIGEIASALFTVLCFSLSTPGEKDSPAASLFAALRETSGPLMLLALPLMGNRLVLNVLASAEAIWIPSRLAAFGLTSSEAFSVYGVLTGMAFPFILFPSAISNSMAVLLLPTVAEAQSGGNKDRIRTTISMSIRYSMYMGILCIGVFTLFGNELGASVFHNRDSGTFITILAWLCPFMYLATTIGSILNGLGKTSTTFSQNVTAMLFRLTFVLVGIPRFGILAYLWGMLASELLLALLHLHALKKQVPFTWNVWEMILKPAFLLLISVGIYLAVFSVYDTHGGFPLFIETGIHIAFLTGCYGGLLLLFHFGKKANTNLSEKE